MRVAAVALVLIAGAAVMLIFANTLNAWVLGGLLGGLAALLLSIPISLTLFTLLARRYDARQFASGSFWGRDTTFEEDDFSQERMVYEAEGTLIYENEEGLYEPRGRAFGNGRGLSAPDYHLLPAAGESLASYDDDELDMFAQEELRSYPRRSRNDSTRLPTRETRTQFSTPSHLETRQRASTRILAQHRSAALRAARQEAQDRQYNDSGSLESRSRQERAQSSQRSRASRHVRASSSQFEEQRSYAVRDTWAGERELEQTSWFAGDTYAEEPATDPVAERYQHYPRHPSYPRQPRPSRGRATRTFNEESKAIEPRSRRASERSSGSLPASLVRRAPYLYDNDPLREELAQQLECGRPIVRRSSRYLRDEEA